MTDKRQDAQPQPQPPAASDSSRSAGDVRELAVLDLRELAVLDLRELAVLDLRELAVLDLRELSDWLKGNGWRVTDAAWGAGEAMPVVRVERDKEVGRV